MRTAAGTGRPGGGEPDQRKATGGDEGGVVREAFRNRQRRGEKSEGISAQRWRGATDGRECILFSLHQSPTCSLQAAWFYAHRFSLGSRFDFIRHLVQFLRRRKKKIPSVFIQLHLATKRVRIHQN